MGEPVKQELIEDAEWIANQEYPGLHELFTDDGTLLAWVQKRPSYCDRGHWQGQMNAP